MIENFQKQLQIKILPAFNVNEKLGLRKTNINEVARMMESILPKYAREDIDVTITLLEKNLKIAENMAIMKEVLTHLLKNVMDSIPGRGKLSLNAGQLNFEIKSLRYSDNLIIGACAFISLPCADMGIDEKISEKIFEPFFTSETIGNSLELPIAYRIIKHRQGGVETDFQAAQGMKVHIFIPLNKSEMVNMMTIPLYP